MNPQALIQAMNEKEMINLITELIKYREKKGKEAFKNVITQMHQLLEINNQLDK